MFQPQELFQPQERPLDWAFRRKTKTHFLRPGTSSPANNSSLLYDGSGEARTILRNAIDEAENGAAQSALTDALDHLKGRDIRGRFSYTRALMLADEDFERLMALPEPEPLVQIATLSEDVHSEEYPAYSIQNQKALKDEDNKDVCPIGG